MKKKELEARIAALEAAEVRILRAFPEGQPLPVHPWGPIARLPFGAVTHYSSADAS